MDIIIQALTSVSYAIINPALAILLLVLGIFFYMNNKKIAFMQRMVMGESIHSPLELTISQIVMGILGGIFASIILTVLGVTFYENSGIQLLFLVSVLLLMYKPKIFSLQHAAAILGIIGVLASILNFGQDPILKVNITYLIVLIGVISLTQGVLIILDGRKGYIPVFTKRKNKVLGGFSFNRSWALPITFFIVLTSINTPFGQTVNPPEWWPVIRTKDTLLMLSMGLLSMLSVYGAVSYNKVTFTANKIKKTVTSGVLYCIYGIVIIFVAQLAQLEWYMEILSIILMVVLFEGIRIIEGRIEAKAQPIYFSGDDGISILDVIPKSIAYEKGVRSGDKIIEVDGIKPECEKEVFASIKDNYFTTILKIKNSRGEIKEYIITKENRSKRFGIVLVPIDDKQREKYNVQDILKEFDKVKR